MGNQGATASAARGRIIRKGRGDPSSRRPVPVVSSLRSERPIPVKAAPPKRLRLRETFLMFLGIPFVFAASAGFMWSRPLGSLESLDSVQSSRNESNARFHSIGQEMAGRYSGAVSGVVLQPARVVAPQGRSDQAPVANPARLAKQSSASNRPTTTKSSPDLEALERQVHRILKKHGRPVQNGKDLASAIVREALAQNYDPVFVAAVIKSESAFNSLARSHKGAQGLMQIMPKTGAWLADQQAIPRQKLTDPGHNLKLGISYLKQLEAEYGGNRVLTLIAYNWGPGHVASASVGGRRVPGEVMQYAVKILNDYRRWSSELRSSVG